MIVVGIELRKLKEHHYAKPGRADVKIGDEVLVSTENGLEAAIVIEPEKIIQGKKVDMKVIRLLNDDDRRVLNENVEYSKKVLPDVQKTIRDESLEMKLTGIFYTYDRQKLFIYYTAEKRVDFRKLIRVLGAKLKVRIQMVQIGVRDNSAILGGIGICGRELCCNKFLRNIESVNIDMARNQQISLNPENISGCCGRLLCCLRYENDYYREAKKELPEVGRRVSTPSGSGDVMSVNFMKKTVTVKLKTGAVDEFPAAEVREEGVKDKLKKWLK